MREGWSTRDRVLVFAAHSDDETLGAGGTIASLAREGLPVGVAVATDSASAQYVDEDAVRRRRASFDQAMDGLGVEGRWVWDAPDMQLSSVRPLELNAWVGRVMQEWRPTVVLTPWCHDVNADHRTLTEAVHVGSRPVPGSSLRLLAEYETVSSSEWGAMLTGTPFTPHMWVDITDTFQAKVDAVMAYSEELRASPHPRSVESIDALSIQRGSQVGFARAEAFMVRYQLV